MTTYEKRIEDKRREANEAIARLEREAVIASKLPAGADHPTQIMLGGSFDKAPWICYRMKTIHDALWLARLLPTPSEVSCREAGCTSVQPPELMDKRYSEGKERWTEPCLLEVAQHGGRGFFSCCLGFWVENLADLPWAHIKIDVVELDWKLRASMNARYDTYGNVTQAVFRESDAMRRACTQKIKYGGGVSDSFDVRYYFSGPDHLGDFLMNYKTEAA